MKLLIILCALTFSTAALADSTGVGTLTTSGNNFAPAISAANQSCSFKGTVKATLLGEMRFCNNSKLWTAVAPSSSIPPMTNKSSVRFLNTTYTNNSGHPRMVSITFQAAAATSYGSLRINGVPVASSGKAAANGDNWQIFYIIPDGATYKVTGAISIAHWFEN